MALIRVVTFESGELVASDAYTGISGSTHTLISDAPLVGAYSHRLHVTASLASGSNGSITTLPSPNYRAALAFYVRLEAAPDADGTQLFQAVGAFNAARWGVVVNVDRTLQLQRIGVLGTKSAPLTLGEVYRIEVHNNLGGANVLALRLAEGDGSSTLVSSTTANTSAVEAFRFGTRSSTERITVVYDEIRIDDAEIPVLPNLDGSLPPVDISATTILEPVATAAIQQEHRLRAATLLELTTALALDTPTEIAAKTILELVADLAIDTTSAAIISAETLLELVAEAGIQQEHRIRAETLLELVADLSLEAEDVTNISATTTLELVADLEIATAHNIRATTLLEPIATAAIAQEHNIRATTLLEVVAHEGYTGPGTGIVVPGQRFTPNSLREGDTFRVVLPWAGLQGLTGLAHVNSRTLRDDRAEQDVDLHITPLDTPNIPALAGGVRPVATADQTDVTRRIARNEREQDRIERSSRSR